MFTDNIFKECYLAKQSNTPLLRLYWAVSLNCWSIFTKQVYLICIEMKLTNQVRRDVILAYLKDYLSYLVCHKGDRNLYSSLHNRESRCFLSPYTSRTICLSLAKVWHRHCLSPGRRTRTANPRVSSLVRSSKLVLPDLKPLSLFYRNVTVKSQNEVTLNFR